MEQNKTGHEQETSTGIDYENQVYVENLPGKNVSEDLYSGYTYNGVDIHIPNFSRFKEFEPEEIKTLSDAVVDYMGWDILLGTSDWLDNENCFYFKPITGLSSTANSTFGYGRRKFGYEDLKFKAKVKNDSGEIGGKWLGISFLCATTQSLQWTGNPGYLFVVKENQIELQKWFNSQIMLGTWEISAIKHDVWQDYSVKVNKLEQGVEIVLAIDGEEVVNFKDTDKPFASSEGYFNLYSNFSELYIAPIEAQVSISQNETLPKPDNRFPGGEIKDIVIENSTMLYGGEEKVIPEIYFENSAAMLPLRAIGETLGGYIGWDNETQTARVSFANVMAEFTNTYEEYSVNGEFYRAPVKTVSKNGILYVSAEGIAKLFNMNLSAENGIVKLTVK